MVASGLSPDLPPLSLRDRDYFQHFLDPNADGLYLGKHIHSRVTGNILFSLARRIHAADGSLHGVLVAGVLANYFRTFYDRLQLPAGSSILITRADGFLLFRHPERQYRAGTDDLSDISLFTRYLPQSAVGTFAERSPFDNLNRIISYRTVEGLPVVVLLSIPRGVALAGWRADAGRKIAFAAAMLLLLSLLAWLVRRQLLRAERAEEALRASRVRFEELATLSTDGFWEQDERHRFTWLGERFRSTLGSASGLFAGKAPWELPVTNLTDADWEHHRRVLANRLPYRDLVLRIGLANGAIWPSVSGNPVFDSRGNLTGYFGTARDVTEEMEQRAEIVRKAFLDPLTGLPNRALFQDRLVQAIAKARRNDASLVLFIDLDRFKQINDVHGHHVGDRLLTAIAERLSACLRESDTAARYGGDEFVVLLTDLPNREAALSVASKLLNSVSGAYEIEGVSLQITPSIGVAVFPDHGDTADTLQRAADEAMYSIKGAGRAGVAIAPPAQQNGPAQ